MTAKERNLRYLELNRRNIQLHIDESSVNKKHYELLAKFFEHKEYNYKEMLSITNETIEHVKEKP